ncbi:hypothetical protein [Paenibacillus sp. PDC88]|uniref:F0F1-type ATP synthase n=1 Tax=Paenibacillus provencensis TaxID=441151 RepID=A0ABW3Q5L8_9BACL|nr:hypothetical protein [Paenibacillus sp. PDC88]SDX62251.1 hypothetical protein SAMN05518848_11050 [Paenibacillus sp. PDC88]
MRITNLAIVFVLFFFPFYYVLDLRTNDLMLVAQLEDKYDAALKTAAQDAGFMLNINEMQEYEAGYQSSKYFKANKEQAIDTFFKTLYLNFEVQNDPVGQSTLASYIPAVVVLDYDGYWLYTLSEYKNADGTTEMKHMWRPKKPYAYTDSQGNSLNFTLDSYVYAFDASDREWIEGYQWELQNKTDIQILNSTVQFEEARKSWIVSNVQKDLAYFINKHNEVMTRSGISYTFTLPTISQEDWVNTVDDIGIMAFIQGIPIGDQFYNNYAFGGGRLVKSPVIYGAVDPSTGLKYYYRESCSFQYRIEQAFSSEKEAAMKGYFPKVCTNQNNK